MRNKDLHMNIDLRRVHVHAGLSQDVVMVFHDRGGETGDARKRDLDGWSLTRGQQVLGGGTVALLVESPSMIEFDSAHIRQRPLTWQSICTLLDRHQLLPGQEHSFD